ncbi:MAG: hypothetical protein J0L92_29680 [Deltaproteobacteria bacterium]|nr:hypothetical protein [Deltaproteobacteria bacterium]
MMPSDPSSSRGDLRTLRKTPRLHVQRNLVVECLSERVDARLAVILVEQALDAAHLDAVPGWERLDEFVRGALRRQLSAAMTEDDARAVLTRIDEVLAAVRAPVT